MIKFNHDPVVTDALRQWRGRKAFETNLSSAELRQLGSELHLRSVFSARTTNAAYLEDVAETIDDLLSGKINVAQARLRLMQRLAEIGYDPMTGFPDDVAKVPPAERGTLQDLSSAQRIDLMLKTNVALARNYGRATEGNTKFARYAWPAWELVRLEWRHVERGTPESHTAGWRERWLAAGNSVNFEGALRSKMIALKDSPIWQALADGEGGDWNDTLGHPFPPFAFNSGMDWRAVPRKEALSLGLVEGDQKPGAMKASLAPSADTAAKMFARLSPDLQAVMEARWAQ